MLLKTSLLSLCSCSALHVGGFSVTGEVELLRLSASDLMLAELRPVAAVNFLAGPPHRNAMPLWCVHPQSPRGFSPSQELA